MKAVDRFVRARKAVKADRATELGIAGHQAASKALGNAAGWGRMNLFGTEMATSNGFISNAPYKQAFKPGEGNLDVKTEDY
jgi:hypothetical protein